MALTLASAARLLSEHGLLREIIQGDAWTLDAQTVNGFDKPFGSITYDTRQVVSDTLLCCKGRFKAEYLNGIDDRGLAAYVAENDFSAATKAPGTPFLIPAHGCFLRPLEVFGRRKDCRRDDSSIGWRFCSAGRPVGGRIAPVTGSPGTLGDPRNFRGASCPYPMVE